VDIYPKEVLNLIGVGLIGYLYGNGSRKIGGTYSFGELGPLSNFLEIKGFIGGNLYGS